MGQPNYEAQAMRMWAANAGIECPPRGRVPQAVKNRFHALDEEFQANYLTLAKNGPAQAVRAQESAVAAMGEEVTATQRVYQPEAEEEPEWVKRGRETAVAKAKEKALRAQKIIEMALG